MKLLGRLIFFLIALGVIFLALAYRLIVTFSLDPFASSNPAPDAPIFGFRAPLFVLLMGAIGFGILLSYIRSSVTAMRNGLNKSMNSVFSRDKGKNNDE